MQIHFHSVFLIIFIKSTINSDHDCMCLYNVLVSFVKIYYNINILQIKINK